MTVLLYTKDYIKTKINSEEINLYVGFLEFNEHFMDSLMRIIQPLMRRFF